MKKTYIAPKAKAVDLKDDLCEIIAMSDTPAAQSNDILDMDTKEDYSMKFKSVWEEEW